MKLLITDFKSQQIRAQFETFKSPVKL